MMSRGGLLRMSVQPQSVKPRGVSRMLRWSIVAILFIVVIHFSSLYNSQEEVVENTTLNVPGKKWRTDWLCDRFNWVPDWLRDKLGAWLTVLGASLLYQITQIATSFLQKKLRE